MTRLNNPMPLHSGENSIARRTTHFIEMYSHNEWVALSTAAIQDKLANVARETITVTGRRTNGKLDHNANVGNMFRNQPRCVFLSVILFDHACDIIPNTQQTEDAHETCVCGQ